MQDLIKKYFWIVTLITILVCAYFAARAANHFVAGKFLNDSDKAVEFKRPKTKKPTPTQATRDKQGAPVAARNMFCAECEPEDPPPVNPGPDPTDPDSIPLTALPLQLVATNVSTKSEYSFATILNTQTQSQGAYWVTNEIPSAGEVVKISGKYVDFRNESSKRLERISLLEKASARRTTVAKKDDTPKRAAANSKDEVAAMLDEGIKKTGENQYEIDRGLVDKVLANPMQMARGARVVPSVKNGKSNGFKLYAIRPSSAFAKIGLRNGDTIHAINGFELTTPDKALEVYTKVKESSNLSVSVTRRGKPVTLDYSIR